MSANSWPTFGQQAVKCQPTVDQRLGSITNRCSENEPALLPARESGRNRAYPMVFHWIVGRRTVNCRQTVKFYEEPKLVTDCQRELVDSWWNICELSVICREELLLTNSRLTLDVIAIIFFSTRAPVIPRFAKLYSMCNSLANSLQSTLSEKFGLKLNTHTPPQSWLNWFTLPNAGNTSPVYLPYQLWAGLN